MLTIKHIEKSGHESIQMARSVSYNPNGMEGHEPRTPTLEAHGCTGDGGAVSNGWCCYGDGKVYVMNDAGRTVGNYDLDPPA
jgi:hypothetical protein